MQFKPVKKKNTKNISREWDALAQIRYNQITSKADLTYNEILIPHILNLIDYKYGKSVLDAGCGVGVLTSLLAEKFEKIVGVDPSDASIAIAKSISIPSVKYVNSTIEKFEKLNKCTFDIIVANMVLMDVLNLDSFLAAISRMMTDQTLFVFSMTHPVYWPKYCGYDSEQWFKYNEEIVIEAPFRISQDGARHPISTHVHRPISAYVNSLIAHNLSFTFLGEPMPDTQLETLYPAPWLYPRYLIGSCKLIL